jgi:hypothetical protein
MTTTPLPTTTFPPLPFNPLITPRVVGPLATRFQRDEDGHRTYEIDWHVQTALYEHNIAHILANWPLFGVGHPYQLAALWPESIGVDTWAFLTPTLNIAPHPDVAEYSKCRDWVVTQVWTTKHSWRCNVFPVENPLLEPVHLTGDFVHETREMTVDKDGKPLRFPNFEPITGPLTENRISYPTLSITFNSAGLPITTYTLLMNNVNDAVLWGLPPRCVRFVDAKWERKVYGRCGYYFTITYTFEINQNTFDNEIPAQGSMERVNLSADYMNPESFIRAKSKSGENISVPLDINGSRLEKIGMTPGGDPIWRYPQHILKPKIYKEGNLLLLGIPSDISSL